MPKIELHCVGLHFHVRRAEKISLKEFIVNGMFRRKRNPVKKIKALDEVSLQLTNGTRLGVIGHNGAGKSTLLKLLAGIYPPTYGRRVVEGSIGSLFDLATGFEPEANGWDNIRFRGYLQGETPTTIRSKLNEIAEFSELGEFLDMPIRCYSAGMRLRLAFAIATAIEPEILLIDEVLAAGDLGFQEKAAERMDKLMQRASLMVLVSHSLEAVRETCNQVLWLDHGRIKQLGAAEEVVPAYQTYMHGLHNKPHTNTTPAEGSSPARAANAA